VDDRDRFFPVVDDRDRFFPVGLLRLTIAIVSSMWGCFV
jgi:hypothetical protein